VFTFGLLGHTLPRPFPPAANAQELAQLYVENLWDLRLGWTLSLVFISLYMPWSAQISMHMKAIEKHSRVLTWTQLISGALTVFVVSWHAVLGYRDLSPGTRPGDHSAAE
jgi:hypothetical protein